MKRVLLLLLSISVGLTSLLAVPARRGDVKVRQSDGTELTLRIYGDEFSHYITTADGYTVVADADGDFCYAAADGGRLVSSGVKVKASLTDAERAIAMRSRGIRPAEQSPMAVYRQEQSEAEWCAPMQAPQAQKFGAWGGEVSGTLKGLVILINFSDRKFVTPSPREAFSEMLNSAGYSKNGATGSASDYFFDNSSGKFTPEFEVFGPYDVPKSTTYYAGSSGSAHATEMIQDACLAANADVDFSRYAVNGKVRNIFVYYAGYNAAELAPNTVWPHQYYINLQLDGVLISPYACTSELRGTFGSNMAGIGTFCHEFGHAMGLPDFYDTDGTEGGSAFGLDVTSVMDYGSYLNNGKTPPAYNIMERWMLGWATPTLLTSDGDHTLLPVYENTAYRIDTPTDGEFFLFENRSLVAADKWDYYLLNGDDEFSGGGNGMLVYHVDYSSRYQSFWTGSNNINATSAHECMKLVMAKESKTSLFKTRKWFFPGSENVTSITASTTPSLNSWKSEAANLLVDNIKQEGENIVLSLSAANSAVANIKAVAGYNNVKLTWESTAATFTVEVADKNGTPTFTVNTSKPSAEFEGLAPATLYTATITPAGGTGYTTDFITAKPLAGLAVSTRQYDALATWQSELGARWTITCRPADSDAAPVSVTTSNNHYLFGSLTPSTRYTASISCANVEGSINFDFVTSQPAAQPRPRLNIAYSQSTEGYVRFSVENLATTPDAIVWQLDGERIDEGYVKLSAGTHTVRAVITSSDNVEHLIRRINVK